MKAKMQTKFQEHESLQEIYKDNLSSMLRKISRFNSDMDVHIGKINDKLGEFSAQLDEGQE